jgi:hypothetical protein
MLNQAVHRKRKNLVDVCFCVEQEKEINKLIGDFSEKVMITGKPFPTARRALTAFRRLAD